MIRSISPRTVLIGFTTVAIVAAPSLGQLPVSGRPVPELQSIDDGIQSFMQAGGLNGAVVAISKDGCVVYQRAFGYMHPQPDETLMPETALMRIASVEKPLTGAAIRRLITDGVGGLDLDDHIFNLGQPGGGILIYTPWNGVAENIEDITVEHALAHRGGWNREDEDTVICRFRDPMQDEICIAEEMGIPSPAGRHDIIRYMLGEPLQFTPGMNGCSDGDGNPTFCYSNFGYLLLGCIIEQLSGQSHLDYMRSHIVTTDMWVPRSEIITGRTFDASQSFREPTYLHPNMCTNVFDPDGPDVWCPYGGHAQENFIGHGNFVASAQALLKFMDVYQVNTGGDLGTPLQGGPAHPGFHGGGLSGTATGIWQRGDGINVVCLLNRNLFNGGYNDVALYTTIDNLITAVGTNWPTTCVDGFWVDFAYDGAEPEFGGFNAPFRTMGAAIYTTGGDGAKLHFKPGANPWSGTLNYKMRLDAPLGTVRIGG